MQLHTKFLWSSYTSQILLKQPKSTLLAHLDKLLIKLRKHSRLKSIIRQCPANYKRPLLQRAVPSPSAVSVGHRDAVAAKFCLRLMTRDLYKSDLWHTTTVPPWLGFGGTLPFVVPIKVPIIFETENLRVFWVDWRERHSFTMVSIEEYIVGLFSATDTSLNWELHWTARVLPSRASTCNKEKLLINYLKIFYHAYIYYLW